jgi:hypothetical protein
MMDRPGLPIPVMLGEPIDGVRRSFATSPPVVHLHVAADPDWTPESARLPRHTGAVYIGLLDTGSDRIALRPSLASAIGAELAGRGTAHGIGGAEATVRRTSIQVIFPKANVCFHSSDAAVIPLPGDARSFDLVLGRQFLQHCRLLADGPNAAYQLEWMG